MRVQDLEMRTVISIYGRDLRNSGLFSTFIQHLNKASVKDVNVTGHHKCCHCILAPCSLTEVQFLEQLQFWICVLVLAVQPLHIYT